jgi:hypothetical protein
LPFLPPRRQVPLANGQRQQRLRRRLARRHSCYHFVRTGSGLFTDTATSPDASPTPGVVRTSKSSRYARVYSGTSPEPVRPYQNCRRLSQASLGVSQKRPTIIR